MGFWWFCYNWTITIECFFADWPLTLMVFQWFPPNSGTMVNNGFGPFERHKKLTIAMYPILWQMYFMMEKEDKWIPRSFQSSRAILQTKSKLFGLLGPHFATITEFQWFSKATSPLVLMVFNGCPPLVRRWNGYIPSLKSNTISGKANKFFITVLGYFLQMWNKTPAKIPQIIAHFLRMI